MEHGLIIDIAICILAAWAIGIFCQTIRQPLLIAYLAAGFLIGPQGIGWVTNHASIETIAEIGLLLLLFMIGLEMDLKKMLGAGRVITITALAQILGSVGLGWVFFRWVGLGGSWLEALYLGVAAAMSSTVIIVKLLYDKRELETLAGRITMGVLVLQDLFVILFLAAQPHLRAPAVAPLGLAVGKVLVLIGAGYLVSRFLLPSVFKSVARQPELVLVGALAWCFAMSGLAGALGLSREMGALLAGVLVSTFPYALDVVAKVTSIRDFFVTLFFVGLGMTIPLPTWALMGGVGTFSALLVASRLLTVFPSLYGMRLGHRISLLPALYLCQMSELSLVLLSLGKAAGDVSDRAVSMAAFAFAFLAVASTYGILKGDVLLCRATPWLTRLGLPDLPAADGGADTSGKPARLFLLGFFWTASSLLEEISRSRPHWLAELQVVDYNPQVIERLRARNIRVSYGDISQPDTLHHAGIEHAQIIVCSIPDSLMKGTSNRKLLQQLRALNPHAQILVHAETTAAMADLYAHGAAYVHAPRLLEAADLLQAIEAAQRGLLDEKRATQAEVLRDRAEVLP